MYGTLATVPDCGCRKCTQLLRSQMKFKNLNLRTKQIIGFGIILVIMAGDHMFSIRNMGDLKSELDEVSKSWLPRAVAISDVNINTAKLRSNQLQHVFATNDEIKQDQLVTMVELITQLEANRDTYEQLKTQSEEKKFYSQEEGNLYAAFDDKLDEYLELSFEFFQLIRQNKNEEAIDLLNGPAKDLYNEFSNNLVKLVAVNKRDSFEAAARAEITFNSTHKIMTIVFGGTILLSIFIALGLVRFITVPVHQLEQAAGEVAKGDLGVQLHITSKDEIGSLAQSFNQMTISLRNAKEKMERQALTLKAQNKQLKQAMHELRETQEQLLLKEKMASLGDLVAGVAHEINNPIGAVNASADVADRCVDKIELEPNINQQLQKTTKILKESIGVIVTAGNRIAAIVKSLKNFARLDESEYQKTDIHEGIESSLILMENEFQNRISVVKDYHDIPEIVCYPGQLNQVFLSLLKNATNAIEGSGRIGIKTAKENGHVRVEISDTGKGIPRNKLDKIFDFGFSTGDSRVKMSSGLSTAYSIVQKHHGEIKVDSEVGKGTTFSIVLPITLKNQDTEITKRH